MKKKNKKFKQGHQRKKIQRKNSIDKYELKGKIIGTGKSYAFFEPEDKSGDIFIGEDDLHGAIHGDIVIIKKISCEKGNGEGRVIRIIERAK